MVCVGGGGGAGALRGFSDLLDDPVVILRLGSRLSVSLLGSAPSVSTCSVLPVGVVNMLMGVALMSCDCRVTTSAVNSLMKLGCVRLL